MCGLDLHLRVLEMSEPTIPVDSYIFKTCNQVWRHVNPEIANFLRRCDRIALLVNNNQRAFIGCNGYISSDDDMESSGDDQESSGDDQESSGDDQEPSGDDQDEMSDCDEDSSEEDSDPEVSGSFKIKFEGNDQNLKFEGNEFIYRVAFTENLITSRVICLETNERLLVDLLSP